jgi:hypothetical protein
MSKRSESQIFRYESDLYAPVKAYLQAQDWEVKAEVSGCDAVAMRDGRLLAVEMKLTLNLDVLLQAVGRQRIADAVYIAVPKKPGAMRTQRWRDTLELLKRLNLGLLVVSGIGAQPDVEEFIEPAIPGGAAARGSAVRRRLRAMKEFTSRTGDRNTGGVHGRKLITAYREAALRLAARIAEGGPMSARQLKPEGEKSRGTYTILKNNPYHWFEPAGGGLFALTNEGREALALYGEVLCAMDASMSSEEVFGGTCGT